MALHVILVKDPFPRTLYCVTTVWSCVQGYCMRCFVFMLVRAAPYLIGVDSFYVHL